MLEAEAYRATWDLFDAIPSLEDPAASVRQEILDFNVRVPTHSNARLSDKNHQILNAEEYGVNTADRVELMGLLALSEKVLGERRINDLFSEHFFQTNF